MNNPTSKLALIAAVLLLSACNKYTLSREAGNMDTGNFGNATMQNSLIAIRQIQPQMGYDKYTAPRTGGTLNGKYAAILMDGYYVSAARIHPANTMVITQIAGGAAAPAQ